MNVLFWSIIVAEVGFWVVIVLGLIARYGFERKRLGGFLLALTPVINLFLLFFTSIDLLKGGTATEIHALAAVYMGISIVFGMNLIRWADERFLYYFKKVGKRPEQKVGYEYARLSMRGFVQHLCAYTIGAGILLILIFLVKDATRTEIFYIALKIWSIVLSIDFLISIAYFIWPRGKLETHKQEESAR